MDIETFINNVVNEQQKEEKRTWVTQQKDTFQQLQNEYMSNMLDAIIDMANCRPDEEFCKEYSSESLSYVAAIECEVVKLGTRTGSTISSSINRTQPELDFVRFARRDAAAGYISLVIATVQYSEGTVTKQTKWPMTRRQFGSKLKESKGNIVKYCQEHELINVDAVAGQTSSSPAVARSFDESQTLSLAERMNSYLSAYDGITVIASLVFSFAVSLAAGQSKEDNFAYQSTMCLFHIVISLCIGSLLHCIVVFSLINYNTNRLIGTGIIEQSADFVEKTYIYRTHARRSFCVGLFLFVAALCVLFFDGLPIWLAVVNTVILIFFVCFVAASSRNISV